MNSNKNKLLREIITVVKQNNYVPVFKDLDYLEVSPNKHDEVWIVWIDAHFEYKSKMYPPSFAVSKTGSKVIVSFYPGISSKKCVDDFLKNKTSVRECVICYEKCERNLRCARCAIAVCMSCWKTMSNKNCPVCRL